MYRISLNNKVLIKNIKKTPRERNTGTQSVPERCLGLVVRRTARLDVRDNGAGTKCVGAIIESERHGQ